MSGQRRTRILPGSTMTSVFSRFCPSKNLSAFSLLYNHSFLQLREQWRWYRQRNAFWNVRQSPACIACVAFKTEVMVQLLGREWQVGAEKDVQTTEYL